MVELGGAGEALGACPGADAMGVGGCLVEGVGGGGMAPLGGPYCMMGLDSGCWAGLFGSLTAYMVASK